MNTEKLNNTLLNSLIEEEIKEEIRNYFERKKMKTQQKKTSGMWQKQF